MRHVTARFFYRMRCRTYLASLCLLAGLLLPANPATAQEFAWSTPVTQAYVALTNGQLPATQRLLLASPTAAPNGPRLFTEDYADMVALLSSDDDRLLEKLAPRQTERLDMLARLDKKSPWQRLMLAEVRLHWAFVKLKFGRETAASWEVIKAYKLLTENQRLFPTFLPTYKSLGVLQVMIGSVPESYAWVPRLLGLRGTVGQGLQNLKRAQQDTLFGPEARLAELLIRAYVLRFSAEDERSLAQWVAAEPNNLLVRFFAATTAMKNARSEQALAWLLTRPTGPAYVRLPVVENLLGDIYLQKGNYAVALHHYGLFLATYRGQNFLKDTHYKRFLCHWLAGNEAQARTELPRISATGRTTVEADKAAQKMANTYLEAFPGPPQQVLMQVRLATDGGYLAQAAAVLKPYSEASFQTVPLQAEYQYRLGRLCQKQGQHPAAITAFERAIRLSDPNQLSFGATAALQLGYLYQQQHNLPAARAAFEKALSYRHHEYKNSIDNKARAALSEMR